MQVKTFMKLYLGTIIIIECTKIRKGISTRINYTLNKIRNKMVLYNIIYFNLMLFNNLTVALLLQNKKTIL